jgi:Fur family ferric uptake transcriptional regulator
MEGLLLSDSEANILCGALRHSGYKVTQARRAVIEALAQAPSHKTAPEVIRAVRMQTPSVGRASVYRTLELMTRLGLVQSSTLGGVAVTYVLTPTKHHHHVVCIDCHKTVEFDECVLRELEGRLGEELGFQLEGHLLELYGRCPDCQA